MSRTIFEQYLDAGAVLVFAYLFLLISIASLGETGLLHLLPALVISWILGDFLSGIVHWFADTYFSARTRVIGTLIEPFRIHHTQPQRICEFRAMATVSHTAILAIPVLAATLIVLEEGFLSLVIALTMLSAVLTNQFHKYAHSTSCSKIVRWLQGKSIIISPRHHARHHAKPHRSHYCITCGWMNPLLDRIHFFRRMESMLGLFGMRPYNR